MFGNHQSTSQLQNMASNMYMQSNITPQISQGNVDAYQKQLNGTQGVKRYAYHENRGLKVPTY